MNWEAILLAGGKLEDQFKSLGSFPGKAYLPIDGKPMAQHVLDSLKSVSRIKRIVCVLPEGGKEFSGTVSVQGGETLFKSLEEGVSVLLPETSLVLTAACDLPFLTKSGIENFMDQCESFEASLFYSFVSREDSESRFPEARHTYVRFLEGEFCGGGLIGMEPRVFSSLKKIAEKITQNRKNVFALARIFGISFLLKLAFGKIFGKLSIPALEKSAGKLLGYPVKGILSHDPEIAYNIDDLETLNQAAVFLKRSQL
jgi:GTP:adenosylcobinamide-phosphate guanylyltransferase